MRALLARIFYKCLVNKKPWNLELFYVHLNHASKWLMDTYSHGGYIFTNRHACVWCRDEEDDDPTALSGILDSRSTFPVSFPFFYFCLLIVSAGFELDPVVWMPKILADLIANRAQQASRPLSAANLQPGSPSAAASTRRRADPGASTSAATMRAGASGTGSSRTAAAGQKRGRDVSPDRADGDGKSQRQGRKS